jgi:hypothetical protein
VRVSPAHFVGGVADKRVDDPLVNALHRTIADEAVPQNVPTSQSAPLGTIEGSLEMIVCFITCDWLGLLAGLLGVFDL